MKRKGRRGGVCARHARSGPIGTGQLASRRPMGKLQRGETHQCRSSTRGCGRLYKRGWAPGPEYSIGGNVSSGRQREAFSGGGQPFAARSVSPGGIVRSQDHVLSRGRGGERSSRRPFPASTPPNRGGAPPPLVPLRRVP